MMGMVLLVLVLLLQQQKQLLSYCGVSMTLKQPKAKHQVVVVVEEEGYHGGWLRRVSVGDWRNFCGWPARVSCSGSLDASAAPLLLRLHLHISSSSSVNSFFSFLVFLFCFCFCFCCPTLLRLRVSPTTTLSPSPFAVLVSLRKGNHPLFDPWGGCC